MRFLFNLLNMLLYRKHASILPQKTYMTSKKAPFSTKLGAAKSTFHADAFSQNKAKERTIFSGSPLFLLFTCYTGFSADSVSVIPRRFCESIRLRLAG